MSEKLQQLKDLRVSLAQQVGCSKIIAQELAELDRVIREMEEDEKSL